MTPAGMALLTRQEGTRYHAYDDATGQPLRQGDMLRGYLTIGVGHNLTVNGISPRIAQAILADDIYAVEGHLAQHEWYSGLNLARRDAIINMTFNLGISGVLEFREMIAAIERRDYAAAADAMLSSRWAREVPERVDTLSGIMRTGALPGEQ